MSSKREHQEETTVQRKTRLAAKRERARLVMSNLRQQRRVEEPPEQRKTRLAAERDSKKKKACRGINRATQKPACGLTSTNPCPRSTPADEMNASIDTVWESNEAVNYHNFYICWISHGFHHKGYN